MSFHDGFNIHTHIAYEKQNSQNKEFLMHENDKINQEPMKERRFLKVIDNGFVRQGFMLARKTSKSLRWPKIGHT